MHDDRTPRGWPLPHEENYLEEDVTRLREALTTADADLTTFNSALTATTEALERKADAAETKSALALKADAAATESALSQKADAVSTENALSLKADAAAMAQALALKANNANGVEWVDFGMDTGLRTCRIPATQYGFAVVRGIGLFFRDPAADDPADGETCILPAEGVSGRWILLVPDADWLFALSRKECEELRSIVADLEDSQKLKLLDASAELTWSAIPQAGGTQEQTIPFPGAALGDGVFVVPPPGLVSGVVYGGYVKDSGTVAVRCVNATGSPVTPAKASWTVKIIKEA